MFLRCLLTLAAVIASEDAQAATDIRVPAPIDQEQIFATRILGNSDVSCAGVPRVNTTAQGEVEQLEEASHKVRMPKAPRVTTGAGTSGSTPSRSDSGKKAEGSGATSGSTSSKSDSGKKAEGSGANVDASKKPSKGSDSNPHNGNSTHAGPHNLNSTHLIAHHGNLGIGHSAHSHGFPVTVLALCFLALVLPISASAVLIIRSRRRAEAAAAEASADVATDGAEEGYIQGYEGLQAVPQEDD